MNDWDAIDWSDPLSDSSLNRGLVSWWLCGADSPYWGTPTLRDIVPKGGGVGGNNGTLTNGPTWQGALGRPGGAGNLKFGGTNYVDSSRAVVTGFPCTLAAWVNFSTTPTASHIYGSGVSGSANNRIRILCDNEPYFRANSNDSAGSDVNCTGTTLISAGVWYHVAGTFQATSIQLYVNGLAEGSPANPSSPSYGAFDYTSLAVLHHSSDIQFLAGMIDDARGWGRALSAAEVFQLYDDSRRGYPETLRRERRRQWVSVAGSAILPAHAVLVPAELLPPEPGRVLQSRQPQTAPTPGQGATPALRQHGTVVRARAPIIAGPPGVDNPVQEPTAPRVLARTEDACSLGLGQGSSQQAGAIPDPDLTTPGLVRLAQSEEPPPFPGWAGSDHARVEATAPGVAPALNYLARSEEPPPYPGASSYSHAWPIPVPVTATPPCLASAEAPPPHPGWVLSDHAKLQATPPGVTPVKCYLFQAEPPPPYPGWTLNLHGRPSDAQSIPCPYRPGVADPATTRRGRADQSGDRRGRSDQSGVRPGRADQCK